MGDYDRILKNNIERIILSLAAQYLGLEIKKIRRIREKLQILEREVDFAAFIQTVDGKRSILHLEFQTTDAKDMVLRIAEYHGVWIKKYNLPVFHFVVYLGERNPGMLTELETELVFTGFKLLDFTQLDPEDLIASQIPEEVLLAILGNFRKEQSLDIIKRILRRLKELNNDEIALKNYIKQLTILSRLRKLESETKKEAAIMPISYDIKTDGLYLEGIKEGMEKGMEKGIKKGQRIGLEEGLLLAIRNVMGKFPQFSDREIADLLQAPLKLVKKVRKEME